MSTEKCVCHINGYAVKDATARQEITKVKDQIKDFTAETIDEIYHYADLINNKADNIELRVDTINEQVTDLIDRMESEETERHLDSLVYVVNKDFQNLGINSGNDFAGNEQISLNPPNNGGGIMLMWAYFSVVDSDLDGTTTVAWRHAIQIPFPNDYNRDDATTITTHTPAPIVRYFRDTSSGELRAKWFLQYAISVRRGEDKKTVISITVNSTNATNADRKVKNVKLETIRAITGGRW